MPLPFSVLKFLERIQDRLPFTYLQAPMPEKYRSNAAEKGLDTREMQGLLRSICLKNRDQRKTVYSQICVTNARILGADFLRVTFDSTFDNQNKNRARY